MGRAEVKLGQTAAVIVETPRIAGVIKLPLGALVELQGKTSVWLLDAQTMTVHAQPVQASGAEGNAVIVTAGLMPGQEVVTAGVHVLTPGQKVRRYAERRRCVGGHRGDALNPGPRWTPLLRIDSTSRAGRSSTPR